MTEKKYQQSSIKKNFMMNVILTLSAFIFPLITFPYISRVLLPAGTGKVSFATSLISYFNIIAQLGIPTYGIRAVARVRDDEKELTCVCQELLIINLVMSVFAYLCLAAALLLIPKLFDDRALYIIISLTILLNAIGMEWLYKGLEQYTYITVRSIIFKIIAVFAMFLLVHQESDYVIYGAVSIFAASASNILNFINARKYISLKPQMNYNFSRHFRPIMVFFFMACATTIYTNLDTVMLGFMTTDTDVGYYNAAVKIKNILVGVVTSLGAVLLPRASYYIEQGNLNEFHRIGRKALQFVLFISVPMTVYFIMFAKESIYLLSGSMFEGSILPMQIIMPTTILIGITNITGIQILVPLGKERYVLYSEIAGAATDLVLNWFLIPVYRSSGAAVGTLAAEFVVLCVQFIALRSDLKYLLKDSRIINNLIGAGLAAAACIWFLNTGWNHFLTLLASAAVYFLVYYSFMMFRKDEMALYIWNETVNRIGKH